jgi:chromosome segregation ATPase
MKNCSIFSALVLMAATSVHATVTGSQVSPVSKAFEMLESLQAKIIEEGEEAQKTFDEFGKWCSDRNMNVGFEIKTGEAEVAELSAAIEKAASKVSSLTTKIEELSGSIAKDEADLAAAEKIRATEAADFAAEEKESSEIISTLNRAIAVLSREAAKGSASMMQLKNVQNIAQAFTAMVHASVLSSADASRLTALVQNTQESENDDADAGAPAAAVYKGHSEGIIGTLEDLLEKAEAQLESLRKTETTSLHNFELLKQSLTDEIENAEKDMADAKKSLSASEEAGATAKGDLAVTEADLKEDEETLSTLHADCTKGTQDFEDEVKERGEQLKALAAAKKVLGEATPAAAQTYGAALDQASFLQFSRSGLTTSSDLAKFEAVRFIRDLARKENSVALAQLASRMSSAMRMGGGDPFSKVKSLITDMIAKLEKDAASDASQKAFCDKETSETKQKKLEKEYSISKLATKIDSMTAESAKLKEQAATLQKELAELASAQASMDTIRSDEKALFDKQSVEMAAGVSAVQQALSVLKDYYATSDKDKGAGEGIISMLEVVESDFTKGLAEMKVAESAAQMEYDKTTYMNKIAKVSKEKDVEYKVKEATALDKSVAEATSDKDGVQSELDALLEYLVKLDKMCVAKAEPYSE